MLNMTVETTRIIHDTNVLLKAGSDNFPAILIMKNQEELWVE